MRQNIIKAMIIWFSKCHGIMSAKCYGMLESLRVRKSLEENMIPKQKQEMQIIVTQIGFGEGLSERGKSISKAPNLDRIFGDHFS